MIVNSTPCHAPFCMRDRMHYCPFPAGMSPGVLADTTATLVRTEAEGASAVKP